MTDISGWIEKHADFDPDKIAIRFEGDDISYQRFAETVRRYARTLKHDYRVKHGDRVAYLGLNSPDVVYLLFACARIGAIFSPLNWRLTGPEHVYILSDSAAKLLFCDHDFKDHGDGLRADLPDCDFIAADFEADGWKSFQKDAASGEGDDRNPNVTPETPVLLVYTSGTTGRPKGAVLTQRAILVNALNAIHCFEMTPEDHVLTALPLFHVGGLNIQTTPAFYAGATVTIHRSFDPAAVLGAIENEKPSLIVLVPATIRAVIALPNWRDADLSSLKSIFTGSSMVPLPLIKALLDRGIPTGQIYGSTETAPIAICLRARDAFAKPGSTGKAAFHCRMRIVDEAGKDVDRGVSGEILIQGGNILCEYWGNEEATDKALKDGWFYTGDIGYEDEDGFVFINDRKTDVIISGGENIYPAEVEMIIHEMPDVVDGVVVGRADERWGEVAVAVVVAGEDETIDRAEFLARFDGRLARFKHPKEVKFVADLPRNAMGKVLKHEVRKSLADQTD